jgi:acetamidase/formamidase
MTPLHTGTGPIAGSAYIAATPDTLRWGRLPTPADEPVVAVASGDVITIDTVSHEGLLADQGADPVAFFGQWGIGVDQILDDVRELGDSSLSRASDDGPHAVLGPIAVTGAVPGDVVCIEPVGLAYRLDYGIVSNRHGRGVLAGTMPLPDASGHDPDVVSVLARVDSPGRGRIDPTVGRPLHFDLRPFLGLVGVTAGGAAPLSSIPPGRHGGNLDIRHLGLGSRLFLPVQVAGAGLYVGDPHYAQGDGEVALTAFEAPLRADLRVTLLHHPEARRLAALMDNPWGETRTHTIVVGLGTTLDEAMRSCVQRAVDVVSDATGADPAAALAFLSAAADFQISQAVNIVVGVHCLIRTSDLR